MPPHCDTMDGPVVAAARKALEAQDVNFALAYVPASGEAEVRLAFENVLRAREAAPAAREVADLYFFETVVRIHRAGEGAPYTGLKPAGLDEGPVIPPGEGHQNRFAGRIDRGAYRHPASRDRTVSST